MLGGSRKHIKDNSLLKYLTFNLQIPHIPTDK